MAQTTSNPQGETTLYQTEQLVADIVSENLRKLLKAMGWSQADFALKMASSEPTISNYLKGKRIPPFEFMVHLCTLKEIKTKGLHLSLDGLIDRNFDPEAVLKRRKSKTADSHTDSRAADLEGVYLCYLSSVPTPYGSGQKTVSVLHYGILVLYETCDDLTGATYLYAKMCFLPGEQREQALSLLSTFRSYYKKNLTQIERARSIELLFAKQEVSIWEGKVQFGSRHGFLTLCDRGSNDCAYLTFHAPSAKGTDRYRGGMAALISLAKASGYAPTMQKLLFSKCELRCSDDLLRKHLRLASLPGDPSVGAEALCKLCTRLYADEEVKDLMEETDKLAILRHRLDQLLANQSDLDSCAKSVSEEEDAEIAQLIQAYGDTLWETGRSV